MNISSAFIANNADQLTEFIQETRLLSTLILDENLRICEYNACCAENLFQRRDFKGAYFPDLLAPESKEIFPLTQGTDTLTTWINFAPEGAPEVRLNVCIIRTEGKGYILMGGNLLLSNAEALEKMTLMSNELANMARDLKRKNTELQQAQTQIKTLQGILPICMHCKEIRNDEGYWIQLEEYITTHSDAQLSHGICDKCMETYYPDTSAKDKEKN